MLFLNYRLAIPTILSGKNSLLGAETGCGKTLAYLLPILQQISTWKAKSTQPSFNAPYVLILVPSRELSDQVRVSLNLQIYNFIELHSLSMYTSCFFFQGFFCIIRS